MAEEEKSRFDRLISLTPRRFHISENPPFGVGLVFCGHVNANDDSGVLFFRNRAGIPNCKPGIWTSIILPVPGDEGMMECILHWVESGAIDLGQSVEEWEGYERETRKLDAESWEEWRKKNDWDKERKEGVNWRNDGTYYDDGGLCNVISTEYLTREACEKMMAEDGEYDFYLETLTLSVMDGEPQNSGFCIGGMSCKFCSFCNLEY